MQALAREFNFSETTFVLPPTLPGHTHRVRIFTPGVELPFAGHPNVGTAVVLASLRAGAEPISFRFEEGVGTVTVDASATAGKGLARLMLERGAEIRPFDVPRETLAEMLSLPTRSLGLREPWMASVGVPFCCIPLIDPAAVSRAQLDLAVWRRALPATSWSRKVYVMAGDFAPGGRLKARMWAPSMGMFEDPATGGAAAALAGSLAAALPESSGRFAWTIEQGAELGRPSLIAAEAEKRDGEVVRIWVGGATVIIAEGKIEV